MQDPLYTDCDALGHACALSRAFATAPEGAALRLRSVPKLRGLCQRSTGGPAQRISARYRAFRASSRQAWSIAAASEGFRGDFDDRGGPYPGWPAKLILS